MAQLLVTKLQPEGLELIAEINAAAATVTIVETVRELVR